MQVGSWFTITRGRKKQRKYFKYTRDYEKAVSNVLEFLKEKSMRL